MLHKYIRNIVIVLTLLLVALVGVLASGCSREEPLPVHDRIFSNATVWDGVGEAFQENRAILVQDGLITGIVSMRNLPEQPVAPVTDLGGMYVLPGLINAHGHVGMADGLQTGSEIHSRELVYRQLKLYARYGITTVVSLGDEPEIVFDVRDTDYGSERGMARIWTSGQVLNPTTPEEARRMTEEHMRLNPDWVKIRVDDNLGTREKMSPETYAEVIATAGNHTVPLAAHIVDLEDAKGVLRAGAELIGHSVRDLPVDQEFIDLMLAGNHCITPTLTREISVFAYAQRPDFFDDPFFLDAADADVVAELQRAEVQRRFTGRAADYFREALPLATSNMMVLHDAGIRVALGTDSGPPARFQGYFEHMEMQMKQDAGMTPLEILQSATVHAANCMNLGHLIGTLEPGKQADFIVTRENPMNDILNLRSLQSVYIGGGPVADVVVIE
ncbi:MAG: amidohydrolase family protein [Bacteroidetes bacterium]|nr:amidohydrolase family protein [Bacteroidota bacterium]